MKRVLLICLGLVVAIFGIAIIFGGPRTPHPMGSIIDPFSSVDFSDLPPPAGFTARDGTKLAYRSYAPAASAPGEGSVVLIHGSSATSSSMHPMAEELSAAGFTTYALDIRGHDGSGDKGQIGYIGQLEDDLTDFMRAVSPPEPRASVRSWGCVSAIDSNGRTIWIADAHRDDGKRFVARADEKLTAFMELHAAIHRRFQ